MTILHAECVRNCAGEPFNFATDRVQGCATAIGYVVAGRNTEVTGTGTEVDPFVVNGHSSRIILANQDFIGPVRMNPSADGAVLDSIGPVTVTNPSTTENAGGHLVVENSSLDVVASQPGVVSLVLEVSEDGVNWLSVGTQYHVFAAADDRQSMNFPTFTRIRFLTPGQVLNTSARIRLIENTAQANIAVSLILNFWGSTHVV